MSLKKNITGSIRPRPSRDNIQYYDVILEYGRDPLSGKRLRNSFRCDTSDRKEAENFLIMKKAECLSGNMLEPSSLTVEQYMDEYLNTFVQDQRSPATYRDYKNMVARHIIPMFGKVKLQELNLNHVQKVYNNWKKRSNASDKPLKAGTIRHIDRIFKAALNKAIDSEYIKKNPTDKVYIGKDLVTERLEVYTVEEIHMLQKKVKDTDMQLPVALLFDCVLRRGELLGLCYSDIDFESKTIIIQHSYVESADSKNPVLKDCKTDGSYRKMQVSDFTMKLLKKQQIKYKENRLKYGEDFYGSNRVICQANGKPFLPKSFTRKWARTLEMHGLRHIKLHGTRHSAISFLLSEKIPLHLVQQRAGHQDPKITLSIYSHVAKDTENVVADKWNDVFSPAVKKQIDHKIPIQEDSKESGSHLSDDSKMG